MFVTVFRPSTMLAEGETGDQKFDRRRSAVLSSVKPAGLAGQALWNGDEMNHGDTETRRTAKQRRGQRDDAAAKKVVAAFSTPFRSMPQCLDG